MKGCELRPAFDPAPGPSAGSVRSKCRPPATGKWWRKRAWAELVQPARSQPPAEAKANSGHSVSRSPPVHLAVLTPANSPVAKIVRLRVPPIGHGSNLEGHGPTSGSDHLWRSWLERVETGGDRLEYTTWWLCCPVFPVCMSSSEALCLKVCFN